MKRALLSVSDKNGIVDFARGLAERGWELVSTGGTAQSVRDAGLAVKDVAELTGHPEMMDGRVKTLHPAVHAGILARRDREDDMAAMAAQGYGPIDLVVVNLYPFRETIAKGGVGVKEAMSKVDIGGPTMIRAAAKNHTGVWVVVDPADYAAVLTALDGAGDEGALRRTLAAKVFRHISAYDAAVAAYLEEGTGADPLPEDLPLGLRRVQTLRYGENPDQAASFYGFGTPSGLAALHQLHGKELSYNNILDLDGSLLCLSPFAFSSRAAVCIVKHTTPCGLAVGDTVAEAYEKALRCDPVSAFGSVIAVNRPVDGEAAAHMAGLFIECIVAPAFSEEALATLTAKKNLRLVTVPGISTHLDFEPTSGWWTGAPEELKAAARFVAAHGRLPSGRVLRSVYGGMLAQTPPLPPFYGVEDAAWKVVTRRAPTAQQLDDLRFAWAAVFGVKSNAILLAAGGATLGIGAGQMSRVDSSRIAVRKAGDAGLDLAGSVLASDAFFPFKDGVEAAAAAGVRAIVQPGGSVRDEEVIAAADEHGIAMVFTGRRMFRH
ncbi:MAG: bifunctional phosphoribosylaminoimidazolecarboxamide formyltransferase/IMP cyclohydrolase [Longimicrobiales bacterium]|nr:bifunctional phosphoribosylaminoimidazolecarboxamide formyltransferase/IMP cyclohydrolase [Longimicrobiales bacterium]